MITGIYAGILAFILVALVLRIVKRRMAYKVGLGDGGIPDLQQAIRVHGNFIETVPMLLILMALMELGNSPLWVLHIYGTGIVLSRAMHAYGITSSPFASKGRFYGTVLTMGLLIIGALGLFFLAL